ncbi:leucine-rich repeat-containing protein 66 [Arapaima gigas]
MQPVASRQLGRAHNTSPFMIGCYGSGGGASFVTVERTDSCHHTFGPGKPDIVLNKWTMGLLRLLGSWGWAVLSLLLLQGGPSSLSQPPPSCPVPCQCQRGPQVDCSSRGLSSSSPLHLPPAVTSLDLSNNNLTAVPPRGPRRTPLYGLTTLLLGHNRIASLSLCVRRPLPGSWQPCRSWAPRLKLLSLEKNRLHMIPQGLGGSLFLQVLHLSHNHIHALRQQDLHGCTQLKELHLQHNLISSIHPLAFRDLHHLQILNLSFNSLGTIATAAYLSVRNLNAQVDIRGNHWNCNCDLRTLKRWMGFDSDRQGLPWPVVCEEPSHLAGRDLLQLDDMELTCDITDPPPGSYEEVSTTPGAKVLLPCGVQQQEPADIYWWTPHGVAHSTNSHGSLLIHSIQADDEGLYACISWANELAFSLFDVHIHRDMTSTERKTREVHSSPRQAEKTHSEFVLAICLSVFITFLFAFILGALARPLLNTFWQWMCGKRQSEGAPKEWDNEGFCAEEGEDQERRRGMHEGEGTSGGRRPTDEPQYVAVYANYTNQCHPGPTEVIGDDRNDAEQTYENVFALRSKKAELSSEDEDLPSNKDCASPGVVRDCENRGDDHLYEPASLLTSNVYITEGSCKGAQYSHRHETYSGPKPDSFPHSAFKGELEADWAENTVKLQGDEVRPSRQLSAASVIAHLPVPLNFSIEGHEQTGFSPGQFTDLQDPNFDPDLWNDSGDSFEFSDSFQEASLRTSPQALSETSPTAQPNADPWTPSADESKESHDLTEERDDRFNPMLCCKDPFIQDSHKFETDSVVQPQQDSQTSGSWREFHETSSSSSINEDEQTSDLRDEAAGFTHSSRFTDDSEGNPAAQPKMDAAVLRSAEPKESHDFTEEDNEDFNCKMSFKDPFIQHPRTLKTDSAVQPQQHPQTSDRLKDFHEFSSNSSVEEYEPQNFMRSQLGDKLTGCSLCSGLTTEEFTSETAGQNATLKNQLDGDADYSPRSKHPAWAPFDDAAVQSGRHWAEEMGETIQWELASGSTSGKGTPDGDHPESSESYSSEELEPVALSKLGAVSNGAPNSEDGQWKPEEPSQQKIPLSSPVLTKSSDIRDSEEVNLDLPVKLRRSSSFDQNLIATDKTQEQAVVTPSSSPSLEDSLWFSKMSPQLTPQEEVLLFDSKMMEVFVPFAHCSSAPDVDKGGSESQCLSCTSTDHPSSWRSGTQLHMKPLEPAEMTVFAKGTPGEYLPREARTDDPHDIPGLSQSPSDATYHNDSLEDSHLIFLPSGTNFDAGRNKASEA